MRGHSADAYGFDFIEESNESRLQQTLLEITGRDSVPGWGGSFAMHPGSRDAQYEQQSWGPIEYGSEDFDSISLHTLRFPVVPGVIFLLLVGRASDDYLEQWLEEDKDEKIGAGGLQRELTDIWTETIPEEVPGLLSEFSREGLNLGMRPPLTLFSGQVMTEGLGGIFDRPKSDASGEELVQHQPFVKSIRAGKLCQRVDISASDMMSISTVTEYYLLLTAQTSTSAVGTQIMHNAYASIGFLSEEDDMLVDKIGWDTPHEEVIGDIPDEIREKMSEEEIEQRERIRKYHVSLPNYRAAHQTLSLMPLLYYFYWFRSRRYHTTHFSQILRNMPVGITGEEAVDDFIEFLHPRESMFYEEYVDFLDRVDSAKALTDSLSQVTFGSPREFGIPLADGQTPSIRRENGDLDIFDFESSITEVIMSDVEAALEEAKSEFDDLQTRYDIVLGELNQQLDLIISQQNRTLTQSSVELQEEMKKMTESSIELQDDVRWLTRVVVGLTIVLVSLELVRFGWVPNIPYRAILMILTIVIVGFLIFYGGEEEDE